MNLLNGASLGGKHAVFVESDPAKIWYHDLGSSSRAPLSVCSICHGMARIGGTPPLCLIGGTARPTSERRLFASVRAECPRERADYLAIGLLLRWRSVGDDGEEAPKPEPRD